MSAPSPSPTELIVVGGGGHAAVVCDAVAVGGAVQRVTGYLDRGQTDRMTALGIPWLGDDASAAIPAQAALVLGFGTLGVSSRRAEAVARLTARGGPGLRWATVIHPSATISPRATIAPGAVICAGAIVNPGAIVGPHCIVNSGAIVEHDVRLGAFVQVAPGVAIGGGATVGDGAFLGLGCRVRDQVTVGRDATLAMGAVVIGSVDDGASMYGVPARPRDPQSNGGRAR